MRKTNHGILSVDLKLCLCCPSKKIILLLLPQEGTREKSHSHSGQPCPGVSDKSDNHCFQSSTSDASNAMHPGKGELVSIYQDGIRERPFTFTPLSTNLQSKVKSAIQQPNEALHAVLFFTQMTGKFI